MIWYVWDEGIGEIAFDPFVESDPIPLAVYQCRDDAEQAAAEWLRDRGHVEQYQVREGRLT